MLLKTAGAACATRHAQAEQSCTSPSPVALRAASATRPPARRRALRAGARPGRRRGRRRALLEPAGAHVRTPLLLECTHVGMNAPCTSTFAAAVAAFLGAGTGGEPGGGELPAAVLSALLPRGSGAACRPGIGANGAYVLQLASFPVGEGCITPRFSRDGRCWRKTRWIVCNRVSEALRHTSSQLRIPRRPESLARPPTASTPRWCELRGAGRTVPQPRRAPR